MRVIASLHRRRSSTGAAVRRAINSARCAFLHCLISSHVCMTGSAWSARNHRCFLISQHDSFAAPPVRRRPAHRSFRMQAENAAPDLFQAVVEQAPDAMIYADREGAIRIWNRAAEAVFGYAAAEVVGKNLDVII